MKKIAEKTITTQLVLERSITSLLEPLGEHESTMTLYQDTEDHYLLEWDIPALEDTWHIGLWTDPEDGRVITEYDGVFSLSREAICFLKEQGFYTREVEA